MIPQAPFQDGLGESRRVVFHDPGVDAGWFEEPGALAETLMLRGGYHLLDSRGLDAWLDYHGAGDAGGNILINLHGNSIGRPESLLRFMKAGGRLVWLGFPPDFLDIPFEDLPPHDQTPAEATTLGLRWGFRAGARGGGYGVAPAGKAGEVLVSQGANAVSFFLNLSPGRPQGGLLKMGHHGWSEWAAIGELLRVAAFGIDEPEPAAPLRPGAEEAGKPPPCPGGEGVFVESGSFRISREKALEKLMGFQAQDPASFLLPWARAAAAAGASRVDLVTAPGLVSLTHDGRSLPAESMADPFSPLFAEKADPAGAHTAFGLLTALRSRPDLVSIESEGRRVELSGLRDFRSGEGGRLNRIEVRWRWWRPAGAVLLRRAAGLLLRACGSGRFELAVNGKPARRPAALDPEMPSLQFEEGGLRGHIQGGPTGTFASLLDLHYLGVFCCPLRVWTYPHSITGWIDSDLVTLNLSMSGVVRDEAFDAVLQALAAPGLRLLATVREEMRRLMPEAARLVYERGLETLWRRHTTYRHRSHPDYGNTAPGTLVPGAAVRSVLAGTRARVVVQAARRIWWLRSNGDPDDIPLWFSTDGGVLSNRQVNEAAARDGFTRMTTSRGGGGSGARGTVWLVSSGDIRQSEGLGGRPPKFPGPD